MTADVLWLFANARRIGYNHRVGAHPDPDQPTGPADDRTETGGASTETRQEVMQPYLFLALDGAKPGRGSMRWSLAGASVITIGRGARARGERRQEGSRWVLDVTLDDSQISRHHARLERAAGGWTVSDLGSRNHTLVDGRRLEKGESAPALGATLLVGRTVLLLDEGPTLSSEAETASSSASPHHPNLATLDPALSRRLDALARLVARATPNILVRGPTGAGKEVIVRAIHELLARRGRTGPLLALNCGALPSTLIGAELFGVRRGSFSGADESRPGLVRAANGGTLFLDEVADLGPEAQAAILRVLDTREVLGLGETRPSPVDVVFVSATHRDLESMMEAGQLRRDLYARLAGHEIVLPPLSSRRGDLGLLVGRLLSELGAPEAALTAEAALALARYSWPHNVRELRAALVHALALAVDGPIGVEALPSSVHGGGPTQPRVEDAPELSPRDKKRRTQLLELLKEHGGNVAAVARAMGTHRRQVHRWIARFDLTVNEFRT